MNGSLLVDGEEAQVHDSVRMQARDELERQAGSAVVLTAAFSEFISASTRLEESYRRLQVEVSDLRLELGARNAELHNSLADNERMRLDLQQIVDSMPCGVLVVDRSGEISMINPESLRLLGLDGAEFQTPTTLREVSAVTGVELEYPDADGSKNDTGLECCVHDAGGKRWLEVRNRRLFYQTGCEGKPDQTILILRDVTPKRRAEQDREAGRKAMALAEITTTLAHEIRNPLASLELFAELIDNDAAHRTEWISNLRGGIRSLSATVNNVLSFHGSHSVKLLPICLSQSIEEAIQFVRPLADQAGVDLMMVGVCDQSFVMANESALKQVVLNLVSNAIRYTPAGGEVSLSLRRGKDRELIVDVSDTGCGICSDQMERIFEPGFSGSGDTSGLGLAVCRQIMQQHSGFISASNCSPSGARFTLHFPIHQMELASA